MRTSNLNGRIAALEERSAARTKPGWWINFIPLVMCQIRAEQAGLEISNADFASITGLRLPAPVLSWSWEGRTEVARYLLSWAAALEWEQFECWDTKTQHIAQHIGADPAAFVAHMHPDAGRALLAETGWLE